jgi:hypothetical protein
VIFIWLYICFSKMNMRGGEHPIGDARLIGCVSY